MNTFIEILVYIIETLGGVFLLFVLLRLLLQLSRADFYNPFSQAVVKITNPLLIPLRKVIPSALGIDLSSIILALLVQLVVGELVCLVSIGKLYNPLDILLWSVLGTLMVVTYIAFVCIIVVVVSSFVAPYSTHPLILLCRQLLQPLLQPIQKLIPPMGGLDFSVFFVGMSIFIVQKILHGLAVGTGLIPAFVIGF